jgi:cyclopropane fatty-acyl-phospholipid synthase-like methyltransferase
MPVDPSRFARLRYDDFKTLAVEDGLSLHERVGAPDSYLEGRQGAILQDIRAKLSNLDTPGRRVVDIGCGCGALVFELISFCKEMRHLYVLVDSDEVLARLPDDPLIRKVGGRFPQESAASLSDLVGQADVVISYSVLHYVVVDSNPFTFLDGALNLLAPGGQLLVADIPNQSMRRRFFSSDAGRKFHKAFTSTDTEPETQTSTGEFEKIDDSVVIGLLLRARAAGFDAYVLPQRPDLPYANRREDLLCMRP